MAPTPNSIYVPDLLWLRLVTHLFSFRFRGVNPDVHFSVAFNEGSQDINLHVTRNIKGLASINASSKPRIEIARIAKADLNSLIPYVAHAFFHLYLRPITLIPSPRSSFRPGRRIFFYPFPDSNSQDKTELEKIILQEFAQIVQIKGKEVRIKARPEEYLQKIIKQRAFGNAFYNSFRPLPGKLPSGAVGGIIWSRKFIGCALHINGHWYAIRMDKNPIKLLQLLMDDSIVQQLIDKTKKAVAIVSTAQGPSDTIPHNNPIRLYSVISNAR